MHHRGAPLLGKPRGHMVLIHTDRSECSMSAEHTIAAITALYTVVLGRMLANKYAEAASLGSAQAKATLMKTNLQI